MAKTLELTFVTNMGKQARISVDNPKDSLDDQTVKNAMEEILAANIFLSQNGVLAEIKGARVIERNVTEFEFA